MDYFFAHTLESFPFQRVSDMDIPAASRPSAGTALYCARLLAAPASPRVAASPSSTGTGKPVSAHTGDDRLPVMVGATISFAMRRLEIDSYACLVAGALLTWGMIDVWDGTAGLRTGLDKVRKRICRGAVARKMSLAKTIFGSASMVLGAIGLLMGG